MNSSEARAILARGLKMGDQEQIEARNFLIKVAEGRAILLKCKRCRGEGLTRHGKLCPKCSARLDADIIAELGIAAADDMRKEQL